MTSDLLKITVSRDSVCAGDDCDPHCASFTASRSCDILELLQKACDACPLPNISGGNATWLIDIGGYIGVMAQQWKQPKLTLPVSATVAELFADKEPVLHFRYWCQSNPDKVFDAMKSGAPLPSMFSR